MPSKGRPNILLIMTDQHRFDKLSCLSDNSPQTPHIDSIAREGFSFHNAYTPSPICTPARAALKSGMFPPACGPVGNQVPLRESVERLLMPERLREQGYETALCGKLHLLPPENTFGFSHRQVNDAYFTVYENDSKYSDYVAWLKATFPRYQETDPVQLFDEDESAIDRNEMYRFTMGSNFRTAEEHDIPWTIDRSIDFLNQRDQRKPFFLFTSFYGPHQPYGVPPPWQNRHSPDEVQLPPQFSVTMDDCPIFQQNCRGRSDQLRKQFSHEKYRELIAAYYDQISMIDDHVGRLLQTLRDQGTWDDTMIIFTSDHGEFLGDYGLLYKLYHYDGSSKIPLLIKPPGSSRQSRECDKVVNLIDLYGTVLETAGIKDWRRPGIEARSLLPLLQDRPVEWENRTFSIFGRDPQTCLTMLREDDLKLLRQEQPDGAALYEMYDLRDEIAEVRNVYGHADYQDRQVQLQKTLDEWTRLQISRYPPVLPPKSLFFEEDASARIREWRQKHWARANN